eukprot:134658-Pleurochrysis_carterae.AAC.1
MVSSLAHVIAAREWDASSVRVWVDFQSIPQACRSVQQLAINSLVAYASSAHAFVIVAPPVRHRETGRMCDLSSYRSRMWCAHANLAAPTMPCCVPPSKRCLHSARYQLFHVHAHA